jgi:hypothetical protein
MRTSSVLALLALSTVAASPLACFYPDYTFDETGSGGSGASGNPSSGPNSGGASNGGGGSGVGGNLGEVCGNGVDDDGDEQIDCGDGECTDFVCAPAVPDGWSGYLALYDGPTANPPGCPDTYPADEYVGNRSILAPDAECSACTCSAAQGQDCGAEPTWVTVGDGTCNDGNSCSTLDDFPIGPANNSCFTGGVYLAADTTCGQNSNNCTTGTEPCNVSATVPAVAATGGTCTPGGGIATKQPVSWATLGIACGSPPLVAGGCSGSQVCLPRAGGDFVSGVCIMHQGEVACPPGSFTEQHVFYEDFNDERSCGACACGAAADGTCPATVELYSSDTCTAGSLLVSVQAGACGNLVGNPEVRGRKLSPLGLATGGTCPPSGGDATGDASPIDPTTFCCTL